MGTNSAEPVVEPQRTVTQTNPVQHNQASTFSYDPADRASKGPLSLAAVKVKTPVKTSATMLARPPVAAAEVKAAETDCVIDLTDDDTVAASARSVKAGNASNRTLAASLQRNTKMPVNLPTRIPVNSLPVRSQANSVMQKPQGNQGGVASSPILSREKNINTSRQVLRTVFSICSCLSVGYCYCNCLIQCLC